MTTPDTLYPIVVAGTGGVARSLLYSMQQRKISIEAVITRGSQQSKDYINKIGLKAIDYGTQLPQACICILSVPDDKIDETASKIKLPHNSILLHTAGSVDIAILEKHCKNCGVIYPIQTLHPLKTVDFGNVTLCIEANNKYAKQTINKLATILSNKVIEVNSSQRLTIHMSAIFSCNFTNLMYSISEEILQKADIDFSILHPLIDETTKKAIETSPTLNQTGPAVRNDIETINKHLTLLSGDKNNIYKQLSEIIRLKYSKT